jgi:uncharacterized membrane protein
MKQNTFYMLAGIVGLIEVGLFYLSVEFRNPMMITVAFVAGILLLFAARRRITDRQVDERAALITQKAGVTTFTIFWVIFFATSLGSAVMGLGAPSFPHNFPPPKGGPGMVNATPGSPVEIPVLPGTGAGISNDGLIRLGYFGYIQLALLFLMFFLYVGFRIYYARKYGEWETDEEQD